MNSNNIKEKFIKFGRLQGLVSADEILSYPHIFSASEKIDGGNCQIRNLDGRLVAGSKANYLQGPRLKSRAWFQKLNSWMHQNSSLFNLHKDLVIFGEWSGNHTIDYGDNNDRFFMLDLVDVKNGQSMNYEVAKGIVKDLGIEGINFIEPLPISGEIITPHQINEQIMAQSSYYQGPREGIVLRNDQMGLRLKLYHPDFADKVLLDNGRIDYLTSSRFRKAVFYLVDETRKGKVNPSDVVKRVQKDVLNEEGLIVNEEDVSDRFFTFYSNGKLMKAMEHIE